MPRYLKFALIALGALVVLAVAVAAIVAATFDPNDYKPLVVKLVQEKKQRTLDIPGKIRLTFFPKIGADLGRVSLSERGSSAAFASVDSVRVSVMLLPLLRKQVVVDRVKIDGLHANLRKRKDGSSNFDDLAGGEDKTPAKDQQVLVLAVDGVDLTNADIVYEDEKDGARYELAGATLKIGKLGDGVSDDFSFKGRVRSKSPAADADVSLKTKYTMDLGKKQLRLKDVAAEVAGTIADMKNVVAGVSANADLQLSPLSASLSGVAVSFKAKQAAGELAAKLDVPALKYAGDEVQVPRLSADLTLPGASGAMHVAAAGSASAHLDKHTAAADLSGKVDESNFTAKLAVEKFSPMTYAFDVSVDKLDLDRFTAPSPGGAAKPPAKAPEKTAQEKAPQKAAPEKPIDLSALKDLNAHGSAKIGALKVAGISASNVQMQLRASGGRADVSPLSADLYQGKLAGSLSVAAAGNRVAAKQNLTGVNVGPLLKDLTGNERLEGRGNVTLDVTSQGDTVSALKKALAGSARADLRDGAIRGVNIAQALRSAKAALGRGGEGAGKSEEKTDFSELSASFRIANGVAHNDDLSLKSPLVRLGGSGDVDIGRDRLDYTVKATVVSSLQGQGGPELEALKGVTVPVKLSGPFDSIGYNVDLGSVVSEKAKERVAEKRDELKDKAREQLKDRLKGLLSR